MENKYNSYEELINDLDGERVSDFEELVMPEVPEAGLETVMPQVNQVLKEGVKKGRPKTAEAIQEERSHIKKQIDKNEQKIKNLQDEINKCKVKVVEYTIELNKLNY